jgi:hypothetical protein
MKEEHETNTPMFHSRASSSGGPDRVKLESYRSSPYNYSHSQRRSSPSNSIGFPYPSSSTSPCDLSAFYMPPPPANNPYSSSSPLLTDNTTYYSNSYYPTPSSYYFPYGPSSSSVPNYPFISPFGYPLNNNSDFETSSFLHTQPPMASTSTDNNPLLPITNDIEQY